MPEQVIINSVSCNLPANIYYCDSMSASCVYVATVSVFPYTFTVPPPYSDTIFTVKIVDTLSCTLYKEIVVTQIPTPTPTVTPTATPI